MDTCITNKSLLTFIALLFSILIRDEIALEFRAQLQRITGESCEEYANKALAAFDRSTEIIKFLAPLAIMSKSQKKFDESKTNQFKYLCINFGKEVRKQYPGVNIWWKLHATEAHLWRVVNLWGFLGLGSEEGFESAHVVMNRLAKILGAFVDSSKKADTMQSRLKLSNNAGVKGVVNDVNNKGPKHINRKKRARVTVEATAAFGEQCVIARPAVDGLLAIARCVRCQGECPESAMPFHIMYSHMTSDLTLGLSEADNSDDADEGGAAEGG